MVAAGAVGLNTPWGSIRSPGLRTFFEAYGEELLAGGHIRSVSFEADVILARPDRGTGGLYVVTEGELHRRWYGPGGRQATEIVARGALVYARGPADGRQPDGSMSCLARAITGVDALFLPLAESGPDAEWRIELDRRLAFLDLLHRYRRVIVRQLIDLDALRPLHPSLVQRFVDVAVQQGGDPTIIAPGEEPRGVYAVLAGEVEWRREVDSLEVSGAVEAPRIFGYQWLMAEGTQVGGGFVARDGATVAIIQRKVINDVLGVLGDVADGEQMDDEDVERTDPGFVEGGNTAAGRPITAVLIGPDDIPGDGLVRWMRDAVAREDPRSYFALVSATAGASDTEVRVPLDEPLAVKTLVAKVTRGAFPAGSRFLVALPRGFVVPDALARLIGRVVLVSGDASRPPDSGALRNLPHFRVHVLGRGGRGSPPPGAVRMRFDPEMIRAMAMQPDTAFGTTAAPGLARIGRALGDSLVGVALGGGGAWGYAHGALLRALAARDVPVDFVAGSSFGALVGAFYCAQGLDGLSNLVEAGADCNRALAEWAGFGFSRNRGSAFSDLVDGRLGGIGLNDLEIPFLPVCTDLADGIPYVVRSGTVGQGVRHSGSLPPLFPVELVKGMLLADGGFTANVPVAVLRGEGAEVVVASNIVVAPGGEEIPAPGLAGALGRAAWRRIRRRPSGADEEDEVRRAVFGVFARSDRMKYASNAALRMFETIGASAGEEADVMFEPRFEWRFPFDFRGGQETEDNAAGRAEIAAAETYALLATLRGSDQHERRSRRGWRA